MQCAGFGFLGWFLGTNEPITGKRIRGRYISAPDPFTPGLLFGEECEGCELFEGAIAPDLCFMKKRCVWITVLYYASARSGCL